MGRSMELSWKTRRLLGGALAVAVAACTPGESRDAPADQTDAAESGRTTPDPDPAPVVVPEGRTIVFRVDETISTGSHEVGDAFTATVARDVTARDGSVGLAAGTPSRWVVTRSESRGEDGQALLAFGLRSVEVAGEDRVVEASVTDTEVRAEEGDSNTESAAKVAVGAAAGAIIGQILGGDTESTLQGAGVGAVVGTVVALTTRDGEARLTEGSTLTVRLDEPVEVR